MAKQGFFKKHTWNICVGIFLLLMACFLIYATTNKVSNSVKSNEDIRSPLQKLADHVTSNIKYIKDSRTGLCFAYSASGGIEGSSFLATVPCEAIPPELLIIAK